MKPTQSSPFEGMFRKPKRQIVIPPAVASRAATRCEVADDGCWLSTYSTGSHGYAQIGWQTGAERFGVTAHRAAWVFWTGEQIPAGMTIDHTCHNRQCVNPDHLRMLPNFENARRTAGRDWPIGECINGHPNSALVAMGGRLRCGLCHPKSEPKPPREPRRRKVQAKRERKERRIKAAAEPKLVTQARPTLVRVPRPPRELLTTCKRGHEFTPENTYMPPTRPGERWCRECMRLRESKRPRRKRVREDGRVRWETAQEVAERLGMAS